LLPGGFSYSDHFGSGKLLALKLQEAKFFGSLFDRGVNALGICNGFQILVASGIFGAHTQLDLNEPRGFVNRWVNLSFHKSRIRLPVRHGEGRLHLSPNKELPSEVQSFLHYEEEQYGSSFNNGSIQRIAGLRVRKGDSHIWGMMPHPEIALRRQDDPDFFATDFMPQHRESLAYQEGDGLKLLKQIFVCS
jgi:phosphoribosylformylglycinamidine synthase